MRHTCLAIGLAGALIAFQSGRVLAEPRAVVTRVNAAFPSGAPSSVAGAYVTVELTVSPGGDVVDVRRSNWSIRPDSSRPSRVEHERALGLFSAAAIDAARRWKFAAGDRSTTTEVAFAFGATMRDSVVRLVRLLTPRSAGDWIDARWNATTSVRVGGDIAPPRKVVDTRPLHPGRIGDAPISGDVVVEVQTRRDGSVGSACVLRSIPALDHYALDAALGWKYQPLRVNGTAVQAVMIETVHFTPPVAQRIAGR
jgi:TonB family protein